MPFPKTLPGNWGCNTNALPENKPGGPGSFPVFSFRVTGKLSAVIPLWKLLEALKPVYNNVLRCRVWFYLCTDGNAPGCSMAVLSMRIFTGTTTSSLKNQGELIYT